VKTTCAATGSILGLPPGTGDRQPAAGSHGNSPLRHVLSLSALTESSSLPSPDKGLGPEAGSAPHELATMNFSVIGSSEAADNPRGRGAVDAQQVRPRDLHWVRARLGMEPSAGRILAIDHRWPCSAPVRLRHAGASSSSFWWLTSMLHRLP